MKLTLEIDDACVPHIEGQKAAKAVLEAIKDNPRWWLAAADSITVQGTFGRLVEER